MSKYDDYVMSILSDEKNYDIDLMDAACIGWSQCKKAILDLLSEPIPNLDLSFEEIDKRFIEKIKDQI